MGPGHPEQPARLSAIEDELHVRGLYDLLLHREAPRAGVEHQRHTLRLQDGRTRQQQ